MSRIRRVWTNAILFGCLVTFVICAILCVRSWFILDDVYLVRYVRSPIPGPAPSVTLWSDTVFELGTTPLAGGGVYFGVVTTPTMPEVVKKGEVHHLRFPEGWSLHQETYDRELFLNFSMKGTLYFAGFAVLWHRIGDIDYMEIGIPDGAILLASGTLAAWLIRKRIQQRRERTLGLCLKCGYDLRASKDRCPECGTPIVRSIPGNGTEPDPKAP